MGIQNLTKNLKIFNQIHILQDFQKETYFDDLKVLVGYPNLRSYICHVDFSILIYKILLTSENMNIVLKKIKLFLKQLLKYNYIYLYIDPKINIRKQKLQTSRKENRIKLINKTKHEIIQSAKENNFCLNNITKNLIQQNFIITDEEQYENDLHFYMTNNITDDENENNTDLIKNLQKKSFMIFCSLYDFKKHQKYILNYLLYHKIITENNIKYSDLYDAEINIIDNIIQTKNTNNVIFSCDQDVILFSLFYFNSNYIYIKNDINVESNSLILIKNTILNQNIAYLTIFFNKSDYFNGIAKFKITSEKLEKLLINHSYIILLLSQNYSDKICLLGTFLQFYNKNNESIDINKKKIDIIETYINNIQQYLNMDKEFYLQTSDEIYTDEITIITLLQYINYKNPLIYVYINNKIEQKYFKK